MSVLWFSGLSGAGKTTLANGLQQRLLNRGMPVVVLDGDVVRQGLCSDLRYSAEERTENLRRCSEVASLLSRQGIFVIAAFISPYEEHRRQARETIKDDFHSIYIKAHLEICKQRDPKGLYQKAMAGELSHFTGISDVFEEPANPDLVVDTVGHTIEESLAMLEYYVSENILHRVRLEQGMGL